MSHPPLIAITGTIDADRKRVRVNAAYVDAIAQAGGIPIVFPPIAAQLAADALARVDGLLLTGGADIDPARYGATRHPATENPSAARDESEIALVCAARDLHLPTLAICRGLQVLNVALGGTLVQDIPSELANAGSHSRDDERSARVHDVSVTAGSRLALSLGAVSLGTNSLHHQSLGRIANGLAVTATTADGVVEGAEWTGTDWWCLGAQWHPEELTHTPEPHDRQLFEAFVRESASRIH